MVRPLIWVATVLMLVLPSLAWADARSVIADGKAATVLVDLGEGGSGSGFCVDASGLFITNRHVIVGTAPGAAVKVIVDPAEPGQRTLSAHVVARSAEYDLAVLKVDDPGKLTVLRLGSDAGLGETDTVTAFGYPFGKMLADHAGDYPGVSVNTGKVTSLRRAANGQLSRLQIDAAVNPGNSGGPVLDTAGRVVGVVVSGIRVDGQSGVNFAIPVGRLKAFLAPAYLTLTPPPVTYDGRHDAADFTANVFQYGHPTTDVTVELTLATAGAADRTVPLARRPDGTFAASAAVVPPPPGAATIAVAALTDHGLVRGWASDHDVRIGSTTVKLAEIKTAGTLPTPHAETQGGQMLDGTLSGLGTMLGDGGRPVDLTGAVQVRLDDPVAPDSTVRYVARATRGGKPLATTAGEFTLAGAPGVKADHPAEGEEDTTGDAAAADAALPLTLRFPPEIDEAFPGGGGRYEVLHLSGLRAFALVDLPAGRVTAWVPAESADPAAAAGRTQLLVATADRRQIDRFDLATGKRMGTLVPPRAVEIRGLEMGSNADAPVVVQTTLPEAMVLWPDGHETPPTWSGGLLAADDLRVSPDGSTAVGWGERLLSRAHLGTDAVTGRLAFRPVGSAAPSYDGSTLIVDGTQLDRQFARVGEAEMFTQPLPTNSLSIGAAAALDLSGGGPTVRLVLTDAATGRTLCPMPTIANPREGGGGETAHANKGDVDPDCRLGIDPAGGRFLILPSSDDRLIVYSFDLDKQLKANGGDWLAIASSPPTTFTPGQAWGYAADVRSSRGHLKFALVTAPVGMAVSADGKLTWSETKVADTAVPIVLDVTDGGGTKTRQAFVLHPLELSSVPSAAKPAADAAVADLIRKPMETLTADEAKQVAAWFDHQTGGDAAATAVRYDLLYLALDTTDDAARQAIAARVAAATPVGQVDVLTRLEQAGFNVSGRMKVVPGGLQIAADKPGHPRTYCTMRCRGSYRLSSTFTPNGSIGEADFLFGVGDGSAVLGIGGWGGSIGLVDIQHQNRKDGRYDTRPFHLAKGHAYRADVYVVLDGPAARISVDLDGKPVLHWTGKQADINADNNTWQLPTDIGTGVAANTAEVTYRSLTLTPISGGAVAVTHWSATTFTATKLADVAGVTAAAGDVTTGNGKPTTVAAAKLFDRLDGTARPAAGAACTVACDGVVRWRSSADAKGDQPFAVDLHDVNQVTLSSTGGATVWVAPRLLRTAEPTIDPRSPLWLSAASRSPVSSETVGGTGGKPFTERFPDGGILVGLRTTARGDDGKDVIASVQAIYVTPDGVYHTGQVHGDTGVKAVETIAPPGYAVGAIDAQGGHLLETFRQRFARLTPAKLEFDDGFQSWTWVGSGDVDMSRVTELAGQGKPIVGLVGRGGVSVDALGVMTAP